MEIDKTNNSGNGHFYAYWNSSYSVCPPGSFTRSTDGLFFEDCVTIPNDPYWGTQAVAANGDLYIGGADGGSFRHEPKKILYKLDFPRMEEGGLDAVFFAIFVFQGPRTAEGNEIAKQKVLQTFTAIQKSLEQNNSAAELALTPEDAYRLERKGKRAIFIGMENGYPVGTDLSLIKTYYDLEAHVT